MKRKNKTEQTIFYYDKGKCDRAGEIYEVCKLIRDNDVKICASILFELADKAEGRKLARVDVLKYIMFHTGKKTPSAVKSVLRRMQKYGICQGCDGGFSQIVGEPNKVKKFLFEMGLGKDR